MDEPTVVDEAVCRPLIQVTTVNTTAITATTTKPVRIAPPNSLSCQFGFLSRFIPAETELWRKCSSAAVGEKSKASAGQKEMSMHIQTSDVTT